MTAVENRYSMMARQYEELFPLLEELNVGLVAFSPMANGLLTGRYGKNDRFDPKLDYRSNMPQFTPEAADQTASCWPCWTGWLPKKAAPRRRSAWPGCCAKRPWIVPIPAPAGWSA